MAKDAYYFSHDSNARSDPKVLAMRAAYGTEGYGRFWILIEILREQDEYKLRKTKFIWHTLAQEMQCTVEEIRTFISLCIKEYELLDEDETHIWSNSLLRRMKYLDDIREKRRDAAHKRWKKDHESENIANALDLQSGCNANVELSKSRKENEMNKENKTNEFRKFWEVYPRKLEISKAKTAEEWYKLIENGVSAIDLIEAAKKYASSVRSAKTEEKFIKMPQNFLIESIYKHYLPALPPDCETCQYKPDCENGIISTQSEQFGRVYSGVRPCPF